MTEEQIKQKAEAEADKVIIGSGMDRASVIHLKHLLVTMYMQGATEATKEYEKENTELKEANATLAMMNNNMWVELEEKRAESQGITNRLHQLIEAKEIIKKLLEEEKDNMYWEMNGSDKSSYYEVRKEAEQFLKETE